jgi:hypothetical protein
LNDPPQNTRFSHTSGELDKMTINDKQKNKKTKEKRKKKKKNLLSPTKNGH